MVARCCDLIMERVLIIGHSYVRRLARTNFDIGFTDIGRTEVDLQGWVGQYPINLLQHVDGAVDWFLLNGIPDLLILVLGSNDIVSEHWTTGEDLANKTVRLARRFLEKGVPRVAITEVLPRYGPRALSRLPWMSTERAQEWFYHRMLGYNTKIKWHAKHTAGIAFLRLQGLHTFVSDYLEDGLHLSAEGRQLFVKALRKSCVVELKRGRPWFH